jgi:hypothetical protein
MALDPAQAFYQIIPAPEEAAELFLFFLRNVYASKMTRSQVMTQIAAVYLITFVYALLVCSWYIPWIYNQHVPACLCEISVNMIAAAAGFITTLNRVIFIVLLDVMNKGVCLSFHREVFQYHLTFL